REPAEGLRGPAPRFSLRPRRARARGAGERGPPLHGVRRRRPDRRPAGDGPRAPARAARAGAGVMASPAPLADAVLWHDIECGGYAADLGLWRELADAAD